MKSKFIRKYMALAKFIGEDQPICYSRAIGAVITNAEGTRILGTGYNGPPRGVPHCDSPKYLTLMDKLIEDWDCEYLRVTHGVQCFESFTYKKICPRRLIGAKSGERLELCPAQHAERNAITNACCDLTGALMFCYCPMPCFKCAGAIIQAGITDVYCLPGHYDKMSNWLFQQAGVTIHEVDNF
jgi:dCMP deaminase